MNNLISTLKEILGDCKRIHSSVCTSKTSYELTTDRTFYILDDRHDQHPVRLVRKTQDYQLTVNNRNKVENEVCIIKTDKCLFTDVTKKCDCILFNKNKFFFVEISEPGCSHRGKKRKHAVVQLGTTIEILKQNNIDISSYEATAIICFKNRVSKIPQPSQLLRRVEFQNKHNIPLVEDNEIWF